ncbi:peptide deformylase [Fusobacterium ulcerans]|uniref:peptide deformylase n=1 Tax=Fusobacterium ulcerans TaxID=861 RepID=UPI002672741F|nr:peptide deformylase [Fusobacterium ulcerans]
MKREILLLGNEELYQISEPVKPDEIETLKSVVQDLHDTLMDFREKYHAGRAIAAPQIGVKKRLLYMFIDKPVVFINPVLEFPDNEMMEVLDDCMSFPNLLVKVMRHKRCRIKYLDMDWKEQVMSLEGDLSELLQHEFDHLDGILATMRAIDNKSFVIKNVN